MDSKIRIVDLKSTVLDGQPVDLLEVQKITVELAEELSTLLTQYSIEYKKLSNYSIIVDELLEEETVRVGQEEADKPSNTSARTGRALGSKEKEALVTRNVRDLCRQRYDNKDLVRKRNIQQAKVEYLERETKSLSTIAELMHRVSVIEMHVRNKTAAGVLDG